MRSTPALLLLVLAACGGAAKGPTLPPEPPPRDLGPIEIGPVAPEARHIDAETYSVDIEGPTAARVKDRVVATITVKTKGDLVLQNLPTWKLEPVGPRDVDFLQPQAAPIPPLQAKTEVKYLVTIVPLRAGVKHLAFKVGGSVCDADFCDVVAEQVSFNLDVK